MLFLLLKVTQPCFEPAVTKSRILLFKLSKKREKNTITAVWCLDPSQQRNCVIIKRQKDRLTTAGEGMWMIDTERGRI